MTYTWIPFLVIALDQMSKRVAMHWHYNDIVVKYTYLENKIMWNKGISFGMLGESYYSMLVYCGIIASILLIVATWAKAKSKFDLIAWGLIVGGGLSNLWDRWFFGAVLDFIALSINEINFPWIFNVADIAITIGALLLVRKVSFKKSAKKAAVSQKEK